MNMREIAMETKKTSTSISPIGSHDWHAEFGLHVRFSRFPVDGIKKCLRNITEPEVFLRELPEHVEIVIKLPRPSDIFPDEIRQGLEQSGITLPRVFEANLWQKLSAGKSSIWAELAGPAVESYRQLWLAFFNMATEGQVHPIQVQGRRRLETEIASEGRIKQKRGRPSGIKAELASIERRYRELLPTCVLIHDAAEAAVSSATSRIKNLPIPQIRRIIFERTRRSVHGLPFVNRIFGGDAFSETSYGSKHAKLHDPQSWKPHHLAISLLTFERLQAHETLEKKLRRQRGSLLASSSKRI
jgi:hypothetical protein